MVRNMIQVVIWVLALVVTMPALADEWTAGETFRDCDECPEMVVIPTGTFTMGSALSEPGRYVSEGPPRQVTIADAFAVGVYEVTFREWDACVAAGGCDGYRPDDAGWGRGLRPVINLSWHDIPPYLRWLSERTGHDYRLLSEAEWEYAVRAGTQTAFYTGDQLTTDQANFDGDYTYNGSPVGVDRRKTLEVGAFADNPFGLHDMYGNAWEWLEDCWQDGYAAAPIDGSAYAGGDCSVRALRGGAWHTVSRDMRSAYRFWFLSDLRYISFGFRVARTLNPE